MEDQETLECGNEEEVATDYKQNVIQVEAGPLEQQETKEEAPIAVKKVEEHTVVSTDEGKAVDGREKHTQGGIEEENEMEEDDEIKCSNVKLGSRPAGQNHPVLSMLLENQPEIDNIIEEVAKRRNLTVLNVKSILRVSRR